MQESPIFPFTSKRHGWSSSVHCGPASLSSRVGTLVPPPVQGSVGKVPATAPFSSPLHHWYCR